MEFKLDDKDIELLAHKVAEKIQHITIPPTNLLTVEELASVLQVPKSWIYDRTRDRTSNGLPKIKVGKYVRFNLPEVIEWFKNQDEQ